MDLKCVNCLLTANLTGELLFICVFYAWQQVSWFLNCSNKQFVNNNTTIKWHYFCFDNLHITLSFATVCAWCEYCQIINFGHPFAGFWYNCHGSADRIGQEASRALRVLVKGMRGHNQIYLQSYSSQVNDTTTTLNKLYNQRRGTRRFWICKNGWIR